ncbi:PRC-barrel domain-containing protein [Pseudonocardia sp. RS010]|uniref:PRC-barrel domain-containing protein n=1 Tax=Pseudonocardia sp. RS010 TaxID=3385979 RepID=UPI0039A2EDF6
MADLDDPARVQGLTVRDRDGAELGTVDAVYVDDETQKPEWVVLTGGLSHSRHAALPLADAVLEDGAVHVPYDAEQLRTAPEVPEGTLSPRTEAALFDHYGVPHGGPTETAQVDEPRPRPSGRHGAGRHERVEDDRVERDHVAAGADGFDDPGAPDTASGGDAVPGVRGG